MGFTESGLKLHMNAKRTEQFNAMIFKTNIKQRQEIRAKYKELYQENLMEVISDKFRWHQIYKEMLSLLMMTKQELYTHCIEVAVKSMKDVKILSSLMCIQDNKTLEQIRTSYNKQHGHTLEHRIDSLTKNIWGKRTAINKFLLKIINLKRRENKNGFDWIDVELVRKDASNLLLMAMSDHKTGKKGLEFKNIFCNIFSKRSFEHLYFVAMQFEASSVSSLTLYEYTMNVYEHTKDDMFYAIGSMLLWLTKRDDFYANLLGDAVYHHGPKRVMFLWIIADRHCIDLRNIIDKYGRMALQKWIKYDFMRKDADAARLVGILSGLHVDRTWLDESCYLSL